MAWCFSTRISVATVLTMHPCFFRCLRVRTTVAPVLITTRAALNTEVHSDSEISICAEGWDCETVGLWYCLGLYVHAEDGHHEKLTKMSQLNGQHLSDLFMTAPLPGWQFFVVLYIEQLFYLYYQPTNQRHHETGLWSSLGTHGSLVVMWWLCISCGAENFDFLS